MRWLSSMITLNTCKEVSLVESWITKENEAQLERRLKWARILIDDGIGFTVSLRWNYSVGVGVGEREGERVERVGEWRGRASNRTLFLFMPLLPTNQSASFRFLFPFYLR